MKLCQQRKCSHTQVTTPHDTVQKAALLCLYQALAYPLVICNLQGAFKYLN